MRLNLLILIAFSRTCIGAEVNNCADIYASGSIDINYSVEKNIEISQKSQYQLKSIKRRPELGKGILMIANRGLSDPNFRHTVILITEFSETGTVGLVINRSVRMPANKIFPHIEKINSDLGPLHIGGPVAVNSLSLLIQTQDGSGLSTNIFANIYLVNRPDTFNLILRGDLNSTAIRLYAGYAGWAAGQLESEIIRGDWYLWPADEDAIFTKFPDSLWHELIQLVSANWATNNRRNENITLRFVPTYNIPTNIFSNTGGL